MFIIRKHRGYTQAFLLFLLADDRREGHDTPSENQHSEGGVGVGGGSQFVTSEGLPKHCISPSSLMFDPICDGYNTPAGRKRRGGGGYNKISEELITW